jgi:hypothetical protein
MKDLEASTFQKRPAYRYIRKSDNVPDIDTCATNPIARVKLFNPCGGWTWYIVEYDPIRRIAWGLVVGLEREIGEFSMAELVDFRNQFGLPLERDLHWGSRRLSEC